MSLIFTIGVLSLAATAFLYFWNDVREFLNNTVRDIIEKALGKKWSDQFAELIIGLDNIAFFVKKTVQKSYEWFKQNFVMESKYERVRGGKMVTKTTTVLIQRSPTVMQETTIEENVNWQDVPAPVRNDVVRNKADSATIDDMAVVERRYQEQLKMAH